MDKYQSVAAHKGYWDLKEVLSTWKVAWIAEYRSLSQVALKGRRQQRRRTLSAFAKSHIETCGKQSWMTGRCMFENFRMLCLLTMFSLAMVRLVAY